MHPDPARATVVAAYGAASALYIEAFPDAGTAHEEDRALIAAWASSVDGPILDAGSGPGLWTVFLHDLGHDVSGIDATPEFVAHARRIRPDLSWTLGDLRDPGIADGTLGGVLVWFSLIHLVPEEVPEALRGLVRLLKPSGRLLIGFFTQPRMQAFDHRITTAWAWPTETMSAALQEAGLTVDEHHERPAPRDRINAAIVATRRA